MGETLVIFFNSFRSTAFNTSPWTTSCKSDYLLFFWVGVGVNYTSKPLIMHGNDRYQALASYLACPSTTASWMAHTSSAISIVLPLSRSATSPAKLRTVDIGPSGLADDYLQLLKVRKLFWILARVTSLSHVRACVNLQSQTANRNCLWCHDGVVYNSSVPR